MAKKKEMNRTSGTAKRKISQAEQIRYGMKTGKPLTGSASGVKSISLKQAGEALTQGIVTIRGGKLQFAPEGLAMALPVGKVLKAAKVFRAAGKTRVAAALESRLKAKSAGNLLAKDLSPKREPGTGISGFLYGYGKTDRAASRSIFPRAPKNNLGDLEFLPGVTKTQAAQRMAYGDDFAKRPTFRTGIDPFTGTGSKLPTAGSVEMVKKTAKQFGQKVSGKEANNISRLLRGRGR